jgi:hypothetical protein
MAQVYDKLLIKSREKKGCLLQKKAALINK